MSEPIILTKTNETWIDVDCTPDLFMEMDEFFTFKAPNYKFDPRYKKGHWSGNLHLLNKRFTRIYLGLLPYIIHFCKERGYRYILKNFEDISNNINSASLEKWIEKLKITDDEGDRLIPRGYQKKALSLIINKKRRVIISPTGSGKSAILYMAVAHLMSQRIYEKGKILICVPNTSLVEQLRGDFKEYSQENGMKVDDLVHMIYEGQSKVTKKPIVISTWQSIYDKPKKYFEQFAAVFVDEVHTAEAKCLKNIVERCINAETKVGLTGTLKEALTHKLVIEGLFGTITQVETTKAMMDRGELTPINILMAVMKFPKEDCLRLKEINRHVKQGTVRYYNEMMFLCEHDYRNRLIANMVNQLEGNTLVLFNYVENHGDRLRDIIDEKIDAGREFHYVHGGTGTSRRERVRELMKSTDNGVILASYGTFSTGINIKNIHNIIFASPSKSKVRVLQSIGRGLRKHISKTHLNLIDLVDDIHSQSNAKQNYSFRHGVKRLDFYKDEQFDYTLNSFEIAP